VKLPYEQMTLCKECYKDFCKDCYLKHFRRPCVRKAWLTTYRIHRRKCAACRRLLEDGELCHKIRGYALYFCQGCITPEGAVKLFDFLPEGSREPETRTWSWMRQLCLIRDGYTCRSCAEASKEVHHIIPRSQGGTNHLQNVITLCERCHPETFKQGYAGINTTGFKIKEGRQMTLEFNLTTSVVHVAES